MNKNDAYETIIRGANCLHILASRLAATSIWNPYPALTVARATDYAIDARSRELEAAAVLDGR